MSSHLEKSELACTFNCPRPPTFVIGRILRVARMYLDVPGGRILRFSYRFSSSEGQRKELTQVLVPLQVHGRRSSSDVSPLRMDYANTEEGNDPHRRKRFTVDVYLRSCGFCVFIYALMCEWVEYRDRKCPLYLEKVVSYQRKTKQHTKKITVTVFWKYGTSVLV